MIWPKPGRRPKRIPRSMAKATSQGGTPACALGTSWASAAMARVKKREPVGPGLMHETVIPRPRFSRRRPSLNPCTAHLLAA